MPWLTAICGSGFRRILRDKKRGRLATPRRGWKTFAAWFSGALLRPADEEAVGPDDVLVVVGRVEGGDRVGGRGGVAVTSAALDRHHLLRERVGGLEVERVGLLPAVGVRHVLDVLRDQGRSQVGG